MKSKKCHLIVAISVFAAFIGLMIFATFCDLDISKKLAVLKPGEYQSTNFFGRTFETIGEMPVYLVSIFASSIIIANFNRRERKTAFVIIVIIFELIALFMCYYALHKLFKYLNDHYEFAAKLDWTAEVAYFLMAAAILVTINILSNRYTLEFLNAVLPWAFIVIGVVLTSQFITQIALKIPAGRFRYCTMNVLDDFSKFTEWFRFNGKVSPTQDMIDLGIAKDGMKSFPSGHSCAAASLIVLTSLPLFLKKADNDKYKSIVWSVVTVYVLCVMISRIIMGKHFLSDVLTGCFVTLVCNYLCLYFGKKIFDKRVKLKPLEKLNPVMEEERIKND